jgi:hypothetical protein
MLAFDAVAEALDEAQGLTAPAVTRRKGIPDTVRT